MMRAFWVMVLLYVALRGFLYWTQYHGSRNPELLSRVAKHFSPEDIDRGRTYSRRGFAVRVIRTALDLAVLLLLVRSGVAGALSDWAARTTGGRWWAQTALVTGALALGIALWRLPFQYYLGLVLERRFGFTSLSTADWAMLQAKNLLVALGFAVVAALAWFWLLRSFPRLWVAVVPVAFTGLQALLAFVLPLLLLPLYYQSSPLPEGSFRDSVGSVLDRAGIGVREIYVIDASRYSRHTNAFFAGLGPSKSIYLFDTLLDDHDEAEALTVVAHEAGHWRGRHILKGTLLGFGGLLVGCFLLAALYPKLAAAGGAAWRPLVDPGSLPALVLLLLLASFFTLPVSSGVSRRFEREADIAAVELTNQPGAFAEAEKRLARTNRSQLLPHPFTVFWYYSHPPALERIEAAAPQR